MARRRDFTSEFKAQVVISVLTGEKTVGEISREHTIHSHVVSRWKNELVENAASVFERANHTTEQEKRIAELERMIGRLVMENEVLKKASSLLGSPRKRSGR